MEGLVLCPKKLGLHSTGIGKHQRASCIRVKGQFYVFDKSFDVD